jgi:hypothetical protein
MRKVEESEKRLMSRDYVADVRAGTPGAVAAEPEPGDDSGSHRAVVYTEHVAVPFFVKDNSGMGFDGALAFQSERDNATGPLSGFLALTLLNLFGHGEWASLYYRGERGLQQFDMTVSKTHLLRMPLIGSAGFGLEIREDSYGYLRGELELLLEFGTLWRTGATFRGHETIDRSGEATRSWRFFGADLVLQRAPERRRAGVFSRHLDVRTGTGVADRVEGRFQRWQGELSTGVHIPFLRRHAAASRLVAQTVITDDRDSLHAVERCIFSWTAAWGL